MTARVFGVFVVGFSLGASLIGLNLQVAAGHEPTQKRRPGVVPEPMPSMAPESCWEAETLRRLAGCSQMDFDAREAQMNLAYRSVTERRKGDKAFLDAFERAQLAWLDFRDAHIAAIFPGPKPWEAYGKAYDGCVLQISKRLAEERRDQIELWLEGIEEGDYCRGSVPKAQKRP